MADNNTFVLFEEIKNKLETIYRELKELKEKENNSVSFPTPAISVQGNGLQDQEVLKQHELQTKEILEKPLYFDPFGQTGFAPVGHNMIDPCKVQVQGSILFYPFRYSGFS